MGRVGSCEPETAFPDPVMVEIVLPLPSPALHAHAKGGWRSKTKPTAAAREEARLMALPHRSKAPQFAGGAVLSVDFYFANMRRRDLGNAFQSLKPAIDGIVDSGLLPDDNWQVLEVGHIRGRLDRGNPRVVLRLEARSQRK